MSTETKDRLKAETVNMIRSQGRWPCWPRLPVKSLTKKDKSFPVLGIILASRPTTVFLCDLWSNVTEETQKETYSSIEELANEWIVD